jgi:hypothetical protein
MTINGRIQLIHRVVAHAIVCLPIINHLTHLIGPKYLHLSNEHAVQMQSEQMQE